MRRFIAFRTTAFYRGGRLCAIGVLLLSNSLLLPEAHSTLRILLARKSYYLCIRLLGLVLVIEKMSLFKGTTELALVQRHW